ncbi:MAG: hypothetical protein JWP25_4003 [Bradyrhizobium sp.]|jgi:hypothetical protein|nr:hypothetical protein [Bradyrhizobium sp.]MEA2866158.1 hypothetical protein [Bradyrhizobium sp.]
MERKLLQIPAIGLLISLAGELMVVPLFWWWQRHVSQVAQRSALT